MRKKKRPNPLVDFVAFCDERIKELRAIRIMAGLTYVIPVEDRGKDLYWTPEHQYEAYVASDVPGMYLSQAAEMAQKLKDLPLANLLRLNRSWNDQPTSFEDAIKLLSYARASIRAEWVSYE